MSRDETSAPGEPAHRRRSDRAPLALMLGGIALMCVTPSMSSAIGFGVFLAGLALTVVGANLVARARRG